MAADVTSQGTSLPKLLLPRGRRFGATLRNPDIINRDRLSSGRDRNEPLMGKLEHLKSGAAVNGILSDRIVTVVDVRRSGSREVELACKDLAGERTELGLEIIEAGRPRSLDGKGALVRLVSEPRLVRPTCVFDPVLAVHTALAEPPQIPETDDNR